MRHAVVVGASGGIGSEIAVRLATSYFITGIDRVPNRGVECQRFLCSGLNSGVEVEAAKNFIMFGGNTPCALIFAAGTYTRTSLAGYDEGDLTRVFWDNFMSVFFLCQMLLPEMVNSGGGRLLMISSQAAVAGGFDPGYAASKGALQAFVKSIAREYGHLGIRCNSISPGPVNTAMADVMDDARREFYKKIIPIGRFTEASEVAELAAFMINGPIDALNGSTIDLDGGLIRR